MLQFSLHFTSISATRASAIACGSAQAKFSLHFTSISATRASAIACGSAQAKFSLTQGTWWL